MGIETCLESPWWHFAIARCQLLQCVAFGGAWDNLEFFFGSNNSCLRESGFKFWVSHGFPNYPKISEKTMAGETVHVHSAINVLLEHFYVGFHNYCSPPLASCITFNVEPNCTLSE